MPDPGRDILAVRELVSGYGKKRVLAGVNLAATRGEVTAIIGHNGAGKSTLLKTVFGMLPAWSGEIALGGRTLRGMRPLAMLRAGVAYVPQGNRVFGDMAVHENLEMGGSTLPDKQQVQSGIERALGLFPALGPLLRRRAGTLSGGEKQMVALAMGLMTSPRLLLLDEPSLGLTPGLVSAAFRHVRMLNERDGVSILIVEQKVREVLMIAHRVVVLRNGGVSFDGEAAALSDREELRRAYL